MVIFKRAKKLALIPMSKTFDLLPTLPRLPVLNLQATVTKYLKTIEPFCASQEEYEKHKALVMDFANTVGPTLQAGLLERYVSPLFNTDEHLSFQCPC